MKYNSNNKQIADRKKSSKGTDPCEVILNFNILGINTRKR